MPDLCTFGQEILLWERFYYGSVSVNISGRGKVMPFLATILCLEWQLEPGIGNALQHVLRPVLELTLTMR
jgi:hypothetical protein